MLNWFELVGVQVIRGSNYRGHTVYICFISLGISMHFSESVRNVYEYVDVM